MVAVVRAGLHNTRDRRRAEGRLVFKCKTLQLRGIARHKHRLQFYLSELIQRALQMLPHLNNMTRNVWILKHFSAKNTKTNLNCNQFISATQFLTMF